MSQWMPAILFCVFATHLPLFAWLYHRTRELRFAAAAEPDPSGAARRGARYADEG